MGNAESQIVRNVDKRTSRRDHRLIFAAAAQRFRTAPFAPPLVVGGASASSAERGLRVCIRKRPIFPHELEQGEFDVISCLATGRVVVHDARMHPDMTNMYMNHYDFAFDEALGDAADNAAVYAVTARDLVFSALQGQNSTVMMYGQTGSGKTFTMRSIYSQAAEELFSGAAGRQVTTYFVELLGDNCFDMLNQGMSCQLGTAADGSVHPNPCVEVPVQDASELLALIDLATKLRATAATGVHDQSSRSHAICRIFVEGDGAGDGEAEGSITLVDLAGSEHRIDNAEHNADRRKEGAKINSSLAALKDCIRATAAGAKFVNFRQNRLTQLLRGCFVGGGRHKTVVIATVSPSSKDTEHSLNTLRHACIMDGQGDGKSAGGAFLAEKNVTKEVLGSINVTQLARDRKAKRASEKEAGILPDSSNTKPSKPAHQTKESNTSMRAALDRKCVRLLEPAVGKALVEARAAWGTLRQRKRLTRLPPDVVAANAAAEAAEEAAEAAARAKLAAKSGLAVSESEKAAELLVAGAVSESHKATSSAASEQDKAMELFRYFCANGRASREWRKNDFRLINTFVVPLLYGPEASLDWAHPAVALDELERLVGAGADADAVKKSVSEAEARPVVTRPPLLPSSSRRASSSELPSPVGSSAGLERLQEEASPLAAAAAAAGLPMPSRPPPRVRASTGDAVARRPPPGPTFTTDADADGAIASEAPAAAFRARAQGVPQPRASRSASPSVRAGGTGGARLQLEMDFGQQGQGYGPTSHQNANRSRREALEQARQESLAKALTKKAGSQTREEEMQGLEEQLASGQCSAAAAVGLKKRLQSLKATAIREERVAAARAAAAASARAAAAAPVAARVAAAATPVGEAASAGDQGTGGTGAGYWRPGTGVSNAGSMGSGGAAVGPASCCGNNNNNNNNNTNNNGVWSVEDAPLPLQPLPGRRSVAGGAAAAPWANEFSEAAGYG
ncbi:unnamed protein product [Polarella glacialis]|uniref:Kinesin-like protein n=1 Tax=Polarella glacialis TaxID=89957 RepID=A0A813JK85_POLGL|nr:unnamed protein product [Polarella glacialis]